MLLCSSGISLYMYCAFIIDQWLAVLQGFPPDNDSAIRGLELHALVSIQTGIPMMMGCSLRCIIALRMLREWHKLHKLQQWWHHHFSLVVWRGVKQW